MLSKARKQEIRYEGQIKYAQNRGFEPIASEFGTVFTVKCSTCGHKLNRKSGRAIFSHYLKHQRRAQ